MRLALAFASAGLVVAESACSNDWNAFDPRLEGGTATSGGGASSGATSGGAQGGNHVGGVVHQGGSGNSGAVAGSGGMGGAGGSPIQTVSYVASVADCIDPAVPDPATCGSPTSFTVDLQDGAGSANGYLRFDLDDAIVRATVLDVTLALTVADGVDTGSGQTGEVFAVESFTAQSLSGETPALVSDTPIGADQGAVAALEVVEWSLPVDVISPSGSVFFGLLPLLTDGVDYDDIQGASPPVLTITYQ